MQTRNKFFDDMSQLMTNAMGVAQGAKTEAETAMKGLIDRWMADRDFVTREEFDAVRAMAQKAREENAALEARIAALEAAGAPRRRADAARRAARLGPMDWPRPGAAFAVFAATADANWTLSTDISARKRFTGFRFAHTISSKGGVGQTLNLARHPASCGSWPAGSFIMRPGNVAFRRLR